MKINFRFSFGLFSLFPIMVMQRIQFFMSFIFALTSQIALGQNTISYYKLNSYYTKEIESSPQQVNWEYNQVSENIVDNAQVITPTLASDFILNQLKITPGQIFFQGVVSPHDTTLCVYLERKMEQFDYQLCLVDTKNGSKKVLFNLKNSPDLNYAFKPIGWTYNPDIILLEALEFGSATEHEGIWEYNISNGVVKKININSKYMCTPFISGDLSYLYYSGTSEEKRDELHGTSDILYIFNLKNHEETLVYQENGVYISPLGWLENNKMKSHIKKDINSNKFQQIQSLTLKYPWQSGISRCVTRTILPTPPGSACTALTCTPPSSGHDGYAIDFGSFSSNDEYVTAAAGGTVVFAWFHVPGSGTSYGNLVKIRHSDNTIAYYAHMNSIGVKVGDVVSTGNILGKAGFTGSVSPSGSNGRHIHFEMRDNADNQRISNYTFTPCGCLPLPGYICTSDNTLSSGTSNFSMSKHCLIATTISCGQTINGSLDGKPSGLLNQTTGDYSTLVGRSGCNITWNDPGPENVYKFITTTTGTINATVTELGASGQDLDVYLFSDCNTNNCVGTVSSKSVIYNNAPPGTYYIVVDGFENIYNPLSLSPANNGSYGAYSLTVNCSGAALTLEANPTSVSIGSSNGSTGTFGITSNTSWSITDDAAWLTVSPVAGSNNAGTITVTATSTNAGSASRSATVTIAGTGVSSKTVTVTQIGADLTLDVSPTSVSIGSSNGSMGTFGITSNTSWGITDDAAWLTVSPVAGSNNAGTITVTATSTNAGSASRSATVTIAGTGVSNKTVTVTQTGAALTLDVSPTSVSIASSNGSTGTFGITSNTSWGITDDAAWLTVSPVAGSNNAGTITVTATSTNAGSASRSATVTIAGTGVSSKTVTITQSGTTPTPIPTISVSPNSLPYFGNVIVGQNSSHQSYTVLGSNLTANIVISAPAEYQISTNSGSGWTSSLSFPPSGGTVSQKTIYVRFCPTIAQSYSGDITHTSNGATPKNVSVSGTGVLQPSTYNLNGTVTYDNSSNSSLNNITIALKSGISIVDSASTNSSGYYYIDGLSNGSYSMEVNTHKVWGGVNSTDALKVKMHSNGIELLTGLRLLGADVNNSGNANSTDALEILRRSNGLINSFTKGDWVFNNNQIVSISSSNVASNFKGLAVGDVNGSYSSFVIAKTSNSNIVLNHFGTVEVKPGEIFTIPLFVSSDINLGALTLRISYPKDLANYAGIEFLQDGSLVSENNGVIKLNWASLDSYKLSRNQKLLDIKFKDIGKISEGITFNIELGEDIEFADEAGRIINGLILSSPAAQKYIPGEVALNHNFPNPFNPVTRINYELSHVGNVSLIIYDVLGKKIIELVNTVQSAGVYSVDWNASDASSGIYFYELRFNSDMKTYSKINRMLLVK